MLTRQLIRLLAFGLLGFFVVQACKPSEYTLDNLPDQQLRFGSGGGFAGTSTTHLLLANGQYFRKPQQSQQLSYVATIDKRLAKEYLKRAQDLALENMDFDHPGNMYYFLDLTDGDTQGKVTWGDINHPMSDAVTGLYKELIATVSKVQRELPAAKK